MTLLFGYGCRDITPQAPIHQAGYAARKAKSKGIHDSLYAKSLYLTNGETEVILCSLDLIGISEEMVKAIKGQIRKELKVENIILTATHTHSGPDVLDSLYGARIDQTWWQGMVNSTIESIREAYQNKMPGRIGLGKGEIAGIAYNRRDLSRKVDEELVVLKIEDLAGEPRVILLNFTCHPTVLGADNLYISADYPGYIYKKIGERYPRANVIFTNGAAGDINIGYSADESALGFKNNKRTFENAGIIGDRLGSLSLELLAVIKANGQVKLGYKEISFCLPVRQVLEEELLKQLKAKEKGLAAGGTEEQAGELYLKRIYCCSLLRQLRYLKENSLLINHGTALKMKICVLKINNILYIFIPGELFNQIGIDLKKEIWRETGKTAVFVCYSNGYLGYLPDRKAFAKKGYEVEISVVTPDFESQLKGVIKEIADDF